jgi:hypothetical protein
MPACYGGAAAQAHSDTHMYIHRHAIHADNLCFIENKIDAGILRGRKGAIHASADLSTQVVSRS